MKTLVFALTILTATIAFAQSYKVNKLIVVDEWRWVDVVNPDTIININEPPIKRTYGNTCGIRRGDKLRVIGIDKTDYLLRVEKLEPSSGTACPDDILFFMET